jgi:hypothetical protein
VVAGFVNLRGQLRQVRKELAEMLFEQQQLLLVVGPNLEARYQTLIGRYQTELQDLQLRARRHKRHLELLRAAHQQGRQPDREQLQAQLDKELWEWKRRLSDLQDKQEAAEQRLRKLRSPDTSAALRSLYRQLVKRLHPDLNPQQSPQEQQMWFETQQAYQWGDWARLETLLAISDEDFPETLEELARLQERGRELAQALRELRERFPYNLGTRLDDEGWVQQQTASLKLEIVLERQRLAKLQAMVEEFA